MSIQDRGLSPGMSHQPDLPTSASGRQSFIVSGRPLCWGHVLTSLLPSQSKEWNTGATRRPQCARLKKKQHARHLLLCEDIRVAVLNRFVMPPLLSKRFRRISCVACVHWLRVLCAGHRVMKSNHTFSNTCIIWAYMYNNYHTSPQNEHVVSMHRCGRQD